MTWSGFDPQLTPMKAARATAAAAAGLLACSICCCNGLLGLLQVTALSHSSIPQFQAWLHPLSPLTTHHLPSSSQNLLPLPPPFTFPPLPFPPRKDPTAPSAACLGAKHLCGSGWPTLPGSQVAVGRHQGPHFQFPSRASATGPSQCKARPGQCGICTGPPSPRPDPLLKLNPPSASPILEYACLSVCPNFCVLQKGAHLINTLTQRQTHPNQTLKSNSACQVCQPCLNVFTSLQIICSPIIYSRSTSVIGIFL